MMYDSTLFVIGGAVNTMPLEDMWTYDIGMQYAMNTHTHLHTRLHIYTHAHVHTAQHVHIHTYTHVYDV